MKALLVLSLAMAVWFIAPKEVGGQTVDVSGIWRVNFSFGDDGGGGKFDMRITQSGARLRVETRPYYSGEPGEWSDQPAGRILRNRVTIMIVEGHQGIVRVSYTGTVEDKAIRGTISSGGKWSAVPLSQVKGLEPRTISGGVLNGKATSLPKPEFPPAARAVKAGGAVSVQIVVNPEGMVTSATAVSGHPLLRASAEAAARSARFPQNIGGGRNTTVTGVVTYNFVP